MHGQEVDAGCGHARHRARNRLGNIVELEVEEDLAAVGEQPADEIHAGGGVQFQADLVEVDARPDSGDEGAGVGGGFHVERDDDGVVHGFGSHRMRTGVPPRSRTRPIGKASVSFAASRSGRAMSRPPEVCGS